MNNGDSGDSDSSRKVMVLVVVVILLSGSHFPTESREWLGWRCELSVSRVTSHLPAQFEDMGNDALNSLLDLANCIPPSSYGLDAKDFLLPLTPILSTFLLQQQTNIFYTLQ
ncbi:hypothetical protein E2C01_035743 [Portunus trituberculatus]|uniref:Uncharacterized protein n=1 Tax=Portunus trituberculatus TaxID=210409 RepID=A0A5B7FA54_PORTR|nr:hypothetical protein [Portunus trituberculatus]